MPLTDIQIRTAKPRHKAWKLTDSGGLYVEVKPTGYKSWQYKYRFAGSQCKVTIGGYPEISLAEARRRHLEAKRLLAEGVNPAQEKRQKKIHQKTTYKNTFSAVALAWYETRRPLWSNEYAEGIKSIFDRDLFPYIGDRAITEITSLELLEVLKRIEQRGATAIAQKARQRCREIFQYAIITGTATINPASDLAPAMKKIEHKHYPFLLARELPDFLRRITTDKGNLQTRYAAKLLALTGVRTADIRFMEWNDIDLDREEWFLHEEKRTKSKGSRALTIPLSHQAVNMLRELKPITGMYKYVFSNRKNVADVISESTINAMIHRIGYKGKMCGHGFRHTASTILNENGFNSDWIEVQLAHVDGNNIRGTYNHAAYLEDRRKMMQWYADYLDSLEQGGALVYANFRKSAAC